MTVIQIKVKPNARHSQLESLADGTFAASVKSSPIDGKANAELIALVARHFGVPKAAVRIKSGASARVKRVNVETD